MKKFRILSLIFAFVMLPCVMFAGCDKEEHAEKPEVKTAKVDISGDYSTIEAQSFSDYISADSANRAFLKKYRLTVEMWNENYELYEMNGVVDITNGLQQAKSAIDVSVNHGKNGGYSEYRSGGSVYFDIHRTEKTAKIKTTINGNGEYSISSEYSALMMENFYTLELIWDMSGLGETGTVVSATQNVSGKVNYAVSKAQGDTVDIRTVFAYENDKLVGVHMFALSAEGGTIHVCLQATTDNVTLPSLEGYTAV